MSTHEVKVFRIKEIFPHENANSLGIVKIDGWTSCIKLDQFKVGDLVAYVEPDFCVNTTRPEFAFLRDGNKTIHRVRVCKLRGIISQGLVVALDPSLGLKEGDNAMEALEVTRYEPPEPMSLGGDNEGGPSGVYAPKYDVETYQKYIDCFVEGEEVCATEKYHGCASVYVWTSDRIYVGSRTNWKKEDEKSVWWKALKQNPWIEEWCCKHPGLVLYGEVFGNTQDLKYSASTNQFFFAAFDILDKNRWLNYDEARELTKDTPGFEWVRLAYRGPFNKELLLAEAEKNSLWYKCQDQLREGIVIKTVIERTDPKLGRVQLKMVSNRYHLRKQK